MIPEQHHMVRVSCFTSPARQNRTVSTFRFSRRQPEVFVELTPWRAFRRAPQHFPVQSRERVQPEPAHRPYPFTRCLWLVCCTYKAAAVVCGVAARLHHRYACPPRQPDVHTSDGTPL